MHTLVPMGGSEFGLCGTLTAPGRLTFLALSSRTKGFLTGATGAGWPPASLTGKWPSLAPQPLCPDLLPGNVVMPAQ